MTHCCHGSLLPWLTAVMAHCCHGSQAGPILCTSLLLLMCPRCAQLQQLPVLGLAPRLCSHYSPSIFASVNIMSQTCPSSEPTHLVWHPDSCRGRGVEARHPSTCGGQIWACLPCRPALQQAACAGELTRTHVPKASPHLRKCCHPGSVGSMRALSSHVLFVIATLVHVHAGLFCSLCLNF